MKQRFIALLLAVCIACTMLVVPASASSANTAVQAAVMLGGLTSEQAAGQGAALTRGQLAKLLAAFSPYRESANAQGTAGTLFTDVAGSDPAGPRHPHCGEPGLDERLHRRQLPAPRTPSPWRRPALPPSSCWGMMSPP